MKSSIKFLVGLGIVAAGLLLAVQASGADQGASVDHYPVSGIAAASASGARASSADYARVLQMVSASDVVASKIAPRDASRVLVDSEAAGTLSVVPFTDGTGFCFSHSPSGDARAVLYSCANEFPESGILFSIGHGDGLPEMTLKGIASDAVTSVDVRLASGESVSALHGNAVSALIPSNDPPIAIDSVVDGERITTAIDLDLGD